MSSQLKQSLSPSLPASHVNESYNVFTPYFAVTFANFIKLKIIPLTGYNEGFVLDFKPKPARHYIEEIKDHINV